MSKTNPFDFPVDYDAMARHEDGRPPSGIPFTKVVEYPQRLHVWIGRR